MRTYKKRTLKDRDELEKLHEKLIEMYNSGFSHADIAKSININTWKVNNIIAYLKKRKIIEKRIMDNQKQGEQHNRSKLTEAEVKKIIIRRLNGETYVNIAKDFNVSYYTISNVCRGKTWKHIFSKNSKSETISKLPDTAKAEGQKK